MRFKILQRVPTSRGSAAVGGCKGSKLQEFFHLIPHINDSASGRFCCGFVRKMQIVNYFCSQYIIVDTNVVLHQMDLLEYKGAFNNVIFLQTGESAPHPNALSSSSSISSHSAVLSFINSLRLSHPQFLRKSRTGTFAFTSESGCF
jgi:hypothetical protein